MKKVPFSFNSPWRGSTQTNDVWIAFDFMGIRLSLNDCFESFSTSVMPMCDVLLAKDRAEFAPTAYQLNFD
jgi:hypothetical protein